jgi:glycosyltransferase involved in cell wall biosynthesis
MNILYLCRQSDLNYKEPDLFARAFRRCGLNVVCLKDDFPADGNIQVVLDQSQQLPKMIVLAESAHDLLPQGLEKVNIPTVSFQSDTYAYTRRRIRWSMLFDYAVVFHPGFEARFRSAGHPRVITWSHAADPELFSGQQEQRTFEVGWVARTDGNLYKDRRFVLKSLSQHFRMNDFTRFHFPDELAEVYCRSKIIVNVARDDYPQDANMRVFEAMASGALLITRLPSELTSIGFEEGVHFVGYNRLDEIVALTRQYLDDEGTRTRIAQASREKVLREHTYDKRVEMLLRTIEADAGRLFAPARQWTKGRVRTHYIDYYVANRAFDCAHAQWRHLATSDFSHALESGALIGRAWMAELRRNMSR